MDFTANTQEMTSDVNITMILFIIMLFVTNFMICRYLSIKLVTAGYVRKHPIVRVKTKQGKIADRLNTKETTEEFKKLFYFWFVPIIGVTGLIILYISAVSVTTWKRVTPKLFLNHL